MNKIMLQGRLVRDPEVSPNHADDPKKMYSIFTLAVKRDYIRDDRPDTDFFRCIAFGSSASYLVRKGKKGGRILVEGRVEINTVDNDNGSRSVYPQVVVKDLWVLDYRDDNVGAGSAPPYDPDADQEFYDSIPDPSEVPFLNA